jgi:polyisoprenoid-binding protein YceI
MTHGMQYRWFGFATSLIALMAVAPAAVRARAHRPIGPGKVVSGSLAFDGRSTMGAFTGTTTTVTGGMTGGPDLASVRGWVEAPVATLLTGKDRRDLDLRKSMESDKYPTIRYELSRVDAGDWNGGSASVTLVGQFVIHGVERDVEIPASVVVGDSLVRIRATTPLNLKDYRIGGLSKLLGMLKMQENIVVHVDVTFGPETESEDDAPLAESPQGDY